MNKSTSEFSSAISERTLKQASMFGQFKATCVLVLVCLMVTPVTLQDQQETGEKGARCKDPKVRNILPLIRIQLSSLS